MRFDMQLLCVCVGVSVCCFEVCTFHFVSMVYIGSLFANVEMILNIGQQNSAYTERWR